MTCAESCDSGNMTEAGSRAGHPPHPGGALSWIIPTNNDKQIQFERDRLNKEMMLAALMFDVCLRQQVNLTRFSLFFPEKREFFLEGQGIFEFGGASSVEISVSNGRTDPITKSRRPGEIGAQMLRVRARTVAPLLLGLGSVSAIPPGRPVAFY